MEKVSLLDDSVVDKLLDLKQRSEANPLQCFFKDPNSAAWYTAEADARTLFLGDLRVTYIVSAQATSMVRQVAIATPLKTQYVPIIGLTDDDLNRILELLGFRHRLTSANNPRATFWVHPGKVPTLNVAELIGETDEELVAKVFGRHPHLTISPPTFLN